MYIKLLIYLFCLCLISDAEVNAGVLVVKVTSKGDSLNVVNAAIDIYPTNKGGTTDDNGDFSTSLPSGKYNITTTMHNYKPDRRRVTISTNDTINIHITLKDTFLKNVGGLSVKATNIIAQGVVSWAYIFSFVIYVCFFGMFLFVTVARVQCHLLFKRKKPLNEIEHHLFVFSFVSRVSTMTGFLGTVIGMIQTFAEIQIKGLVSLGDIAGGISVALVTTFIGLVLKLITDTIDSHVRFKMTIISEQENNIEDKKKAQEDEKK